MSATGRLVTGVVAAVMSGAFWGLATQLPIVGVMTLGSQSASAWFSRDHAEPWWATGSRAIAVGGFWSAVFTVLLGR